MQLSAELLQAQARLLELRATLGIETKATSPSLLPVASKPEPINWMRLNAEAELQRRREHAGILTAYPNPCLCASSGHSQPPRIITEPPSGSASPQSIVVHPTLVLALLREKLEAPGRVYFLLRFVDHQGRGWLRIEDIRRELTHKDSLLKICGWRRLRQLLSQGEGLFWRQDAQDRLWLKGLHRIAYRLDFGRLQGFPIELPIKALLGGIQAVRAAFYACFHGGRDSKPISRETLRTVSGIAERTQRDYDYLAQIKRQRNIAIGDRYFQENAQERAWQHGRATFHFIDTQGRQGRAGREYVAWHLPNSYRAAYQRRSRGSRKRLNRKLADLVKKGIPGNDEQVVERLFFPNGALAARRYNRDPEQDVYWQQEQPVRTGAQLWRVIAGMEA